MGSLRDELSGAPLGHATSYPETYDATLLFRVPRAPQRREIGIEGTLPFTGGDRWTAFEFTWVDERGKPEVAIVAFDVPATSPAIVESKSVKLYLGSFTQTAFPSADRVTETIARDLSAAVGAPVFVNLVAPSAFAQMRIAELEGESLDGLNVAIDRYDVDPAVLSVAGPPVVETLRSDLFRSLCPVTGQPDFASIGLAYRGPRIDRAGLLRYLVSYRHHPGFHEHCAERIFVDVMGACRCDTLSVYMRFTRRGGIDINPFRTNAGMPAPAGVRTARQ